MINFMEMFDDCIVKEIVEKGLTGHIFTAHEINEYIDGTPIPGNHADDDPEGHDFDKMKALQEQRVAVERTADPEQYRALANLFREAGMEIAAQRLEDRAEEYER